MKFKFPLVRTPKAKPLPQDWVREITYKGASIGTTALTSSLSAPFRVTFAGSSTAIADRKSEVSVALSHVPHAAREDSSLGRNLVKDQILDYLNRRFSKVMPAVSLAALVSYAGYLTDPVSSQGLAPPGFVAWLDSSSEATWDNSIAGYAPQLKSTVGTALASGTLYPRADLVVALVDDQPRFNYRESIEYARNMGLRTDFPL